LRQHHPRLLLRPRAVAGRGGLQTDQGASSYGSASRTPNRASISASAPRSGHCGQRDQNLEPRREETVAFCSYEGAHVEHGHVKLGHGRRFSMSRSIEQIVNQQVLRWEEQRAAAQRASRPPPEVSQPVLTISRQFGALGGDVGKLVARNLGYSFYAQELVHEISKHAHVRRKIVESLDERLRSGIA